MTEELPDDLFAAASEFIDELVIGLINTRVYGEQHTRVETIIASLLQGLQHICGADGNDRVRIGLAEGFLVYADRPILGASLGASRLMKTIDNLHGGGLEFRRHATSQDFVALLKTLNSRPGTVSNLLEANQSLEAAGCRAIMLLAPGSVCDANAGETITATTTAEGDRRSATTMLSVPLKLYQDVVEMMQGLTIRVCCGDAFDVTPARSLVSDILKRLDEDPHSMLNLARYEKYDALTFGHSIRVCFLALHFLKSMTFDRELQERIGLAALLHDIGKARIPFELLHSTEVFSPEQRREMEKHTSLGGEILLELDNPDPMSVAAAFGHHQSLDGQGYPSTVHGNVMSTVTRMIKVCDVYEALTAVRPYKKRMTPRAAYSVMLTMTRHFDEALLRRFIEINGLYPVGSRVKLSTGQYARVEQQTSDLTRPIVVVEQDDSGQGDAWDLRDNTAQDGTVIASGPMTGVI